jgi:hypothetical protein
MPDPHRCSYQITMEFLPAHRRAAGSRAAIRARHAQPLPWRPSVTARGRRARLWPGWSSGSYGLCVCL